MREDPPSGRRRSAAAGEGALADFGNAMRELLRSGPGLGGVTLMILLFVVALYVLLAFPMDFGESQWSNPVVWVDNPKAVPPVWSNALRQETRPPHHVFEGTEPDTVRMARSGPVHTWRFPLTYASSHPPTFLAVTLADVNYAERSPLVLISLKRPDGKQIRIFRHAVRGPREGESGPFQRYAQTPLRVQLSTDEATLTAVQNFVAIHIGIDWLSSGVVRPHRQAIGKRVIVLGGGNTAMDCCRTARRLGGERSR